MMPVNTRHAHDMFERCISVPGVITWQYRTDSFVCRLAEVDKVVKKWQQDMQSA